MDFCFNVSKLVLFLLDFVLVLIGLIGIAIGIWTVVDSKSFFETIAFFSKSQSSVVQLYADTQVVQVSAAVLIVISCIVFVLSFCGCWGVVSEGRVLLITYTAFMSFIVLVEVICVILLFALNYKWQPLLNEAIAETFSDNYKGTLGAFPVSEFDPFSLAMDSFMLQFGCCGIHGAKDFESRLTARTWFEYGRKYQGKTQLYSGDEVLLPVACCKFNSTQFFMNQKFADYLPNMLNTDCPIRMTDYQPEACLNVIPEKIEAQKVPLIVTPVIVLLVELACIGLATYLVVSITRQNELLYY